MLRSLTFNVRLEAPTCFPEIRDALSSAIWSRNCRTWSSVVNLTPQFTEIDIDLISSAAVVQSSFGAGICLRSIPFTISQML